MSKLYNLKTKSVEYVDVITLPNGDNMYPEALKDEYLVSLGYKRVIEVEAKGVPSEIEYIAKEYTEAPTNYTINNVIKPKTLQMLEKDFKAYVQIILDTKAKEKGYDNIVSACSYGGYDNEFRQEGELFGKWRANVWKWGFKMLADIQSGKREMPKSFAEAVADMPQLD